MDLSRSPSPPRKSRHCTSSLSCSPFSLCLPSFFRLTKFMLPLSPPPRKKRSVETNFDIPNMNDGNTFEKNFTFILKKFRLHLQWNPIIFFILELTLSGETENRKKPTSLSKGSISSECLLSVPESKASNGTFRRRRVAEKQIVRKAIPYTDSENTKMIFQLANYKSRFILLVGHKPEVEEAFKRPSLMGT